MEKTERISSSQFERVFRELHTQLFYLAYDIVGDKIIAQDIVSDVFCPYGISIGIFPWSR